LKGAGVQFLDSPRRREATFGHGLKEQFFDLNQQDSIALLDYFLNQSPTPLPAQVEGAPVPGILVLRLYGFWSTVMPIRPFLAGQAFEPELIRQMSVALETVCGKLELSLVDDPSTRLVALKIIELAQRGVRDAPTLSAMTLTELKHY
jgi:hypothetical protein